MLRSSRKRDRGEIKEGLSWLSQVRGLQGYAKELGIDVKTLVKEIAEKSALGPVRILDAGVGIGSTLRNLLKIFEEKIEAHGLALTRRVPKKVPGYFHHTGMLETIILPRDYFDFILSVRGCLVYSIQSFAAVEELLNALKPGGVAYLQDSRLLLTEAWFRDFLGKQGFPSQTTAWKDGRSISFRILRLDARPLDLSEYSKIYVELLNKNKKIFLEHGLDRVKNPKPLNEVFSGFYQGGHYPSI